MSSLILDDYELRLIMNLPFSNEGRVLFRLLEHELTELQASLEENPKITDEVKHDMRYRLGEIRRLRWIRDAPKRAEEELKHREKGGTRR